MFRDVSVVLLALCCLRLSARLPEWKTDASAWSAAARSDSDAPLALANASHFDRDAIAPLWTLLRLEVPAWMPESERLVYANGQINLSNVLYDAREYRESLAVFQRAHDNAPVYIDDMLNRRQR